jgi:putative hydrolase
MKAWQKYCNYLSSGEWHVHTSYTDGENSVFEYCEIAEKKGIPLIAFTEHVRRDLDYDFNSFLSDIDDARNQFNLIILSGCEAKILPTGILDVENAILEQVDYPICSFHSFPKKPDLYYDCLITVFQNYPVNTWGHPGAFLIKNDLDLPTKSLEKIFDVMADNAIALELNSKYHVPLPEWLDGAKKYKISIIRGSDIHRKSDLTNFQDIN